MSVRTRSDGNPARTAFPPRRPRSFPARRRRAVREGRPLPGGRCRRRTGIRGAPGARASRRRWAYLLFVLVAGLLLLAHGCHGDEDNELFARIVRVVSE